MGETGSTLFSSLHRKEISENNESNKNKYTKGIDESISDKNIKKKDDDEKIDFIRKKID